MEKGFSWQYSQHLAAVSGLAQGRLRWFTVLMTSVAVFGGWSGVNFLTAHAAPVSGPATLQARTHVPGELIVKMRESNAGPTIMSSITSALKKALGQNSVLDVRRLQTDKRLHVVKLASDASLARAISVLSNEPSVEFSEPNLIYRAVESGAPNDPDFTKLWGIRNVGQTDAAGQVGREGADINIVPLWQKGFIGNKKVLVAVVDTGIDWSHPDLAANLYTNPGEVGSKKDNGVDDDGNGFIDDVHGWNFAAKTRESSDDHNHGTHCAGTIGGVGNNGIGVSGVAWNVTLLPVKFLDAQGGGTLEGAIEAINYARMMKANIMSNSWGGGMYSEALKQAIEETRDAGILFVAAAGNDSSNNDASPAYPAGYDIENVLAVAATDNQDKLAGFSNYGPRTVHVAAPGVKVYSTVKGGRYETFSGTSMATPHVSGIAAVLLGANPTWSFGEIKERLIKTSAPVAALKRRVVARGRVDAHNAFYGIVPPSPEPDPSLWKTLDYSVESAHPYANHDNLKFEVKVPGAKFIRIIFEKVEVETNYDKVSVETPSGEVVDEVTGKLNDYTTEYVAGDKAIIHLKSDESNTMYGFKVSKIQFIAGE